MDLSLDLKTQTKKKKVNGEAKSAQEGAEKMRLEECLGRFTSKEKLSQDTDYICKKCGAQGDATKQLNLKTLPPVLNIHLKVLHK